MKKVKNGLENVGGILDLINNTYNTVDKGVDTIDKIKSGGLSKNFNLVMQIEKKTKHMKWKFYIIWTIMVILTVIIWFFF